MSEFTDAQIEEATERLVEGQIAEHVMAEPERCICVPCESPAYGAPGVAHCAACCMGTYIAEYNHDCPIEEHRELAHRQFPSDRIEASR